MPDHRRVDTFADGMQPLSQRSVRRRRWSWGHWVALGVCLGGLANGWALQQSALEDVVVRNWDLDDGLPSARINGIARTADGYLWLATQRGVVRFDGVRFTIFDTSNTPGMEDDRASCLLVDRQGDLWVGTAGGTLLKRVGPAFRAQELGAAAPPRPERGEAAGKVNALAEDGQGALWLALEGLGLLRLRPGAVTAFTTNSGLPSMNVRKVLCDERGRLWAVAEGHLVRFEAEGWRDADDLLPTSQSVRTISAARDGGLWVATGTVDPIATRDLRLYRLKDGRCGAPVEPYPWLGDSQQFQRLALLEDQGGRLWCATAGGVFLHAPSGSWQRLLSAAPWIQVEVMCLAEDEGGLLWLGTRTTGLLQIQPRQVSTLPLPAVASQHAALTVCAARDGAIWCGTDGAGVFRWRGEQVSHFGSEEGLTSLHVAALLEDRRTNLWAGTVHGLFRRVGERFEPAQGPAALAEPILALLEDRQGNLWTGGRAGLVRLNAQGGRVFGAKEGFLGGAVRALAEDRQGHFWVGATELGLYRLEGERFHYCPVPQEPRLRGIYALHCDAAGAMWIGTDLAGLLRFHHGRFAQWLSLPDGLPSNHLTAIIEDGGGDLWMSSENGLFGCGKAELDRYQRGVSPPLRPQRLTPAEGLAHKVGSGVGQPAGCKGPDGRVWFPNGPALAVFAPAAIPHTVRVWPPVIESVSVDGRLATVTAEGVRAGSDARRIEFRFSSPNVVTPERLRFRFRLEGMDPAWVEAGTRREASYSRLPPGQYQFRALVSGPEETWQEGRGLTLEILPRWWERRPFQVAGGLAVLAGVAGTVWAAERGRSRRRLEQLQLKRSLESERQRIARDIHDDLGSGLTEIILLSDGLEEAVHLPPGDRKLVGEIATRARALTRAMDEVVWAINPRNDTLEGFLTYLGKFTQDYLTRAKVRCRWHVPMEVPEVPLSAEVRHHLYLACKEALHNVVKHSGASEVSVGLAWTEAGFTLGIEDDGQGFAAAQLPAGGNGLRNMRQRLSDLDGRCRVESGPGQGTRVWLSLPVATDQPLVPPRNP